MGLFSLFMTANAFHSAIKKNDMERLKQLLNHGSNPNEKWFGRVPLMFAARNANVEAVKLLLEKTDDVQAVDRQGSTALMLAAGGWGYKGSDKEAKCLETVKVLLDKGADPNACGRRGQTAMRYALGAGHRGIMALLQEKGATAE